MQPAFAIGALWIAFALSWLAAALWSSPAEKRLTSREERRYRLVLLIGGIIFYFRARGVEGPMRLWNVSRNTAWICVAAIAVGIAFAWWARIHLGALWSGQVTKKADHRIVDSGPYGMVRHPIYTGILTAVFATMVAKGTVLGVTGAVLITLGIWMKARVEERWLSEELGTDDYGAYSRRVPMLVPFAPTSG